MTRAELYKTTSMLLDMLKHGDKKYKLSLSELFDSSYPDASKPYHVSYVEEEMSNIFRRVSEAYLYDALSVPFTKGLMDNLPDSIHHLGLSNYPITMVQTTILEIAEDRLANPVYK